MKTFGLLITTTLVFALSPAVADTAESAHAKLTQVSSRSVVAEDLSYETEYVIEWKALTEKGARENGSFPIAINRGLTTLEIVAAETIKADGRRIPVEESGIVRQNGAIGQISLKDVDIVRLTYPSFSAGDSGYLRYRTRNKPIFPGYAYFSHRVSENLIHDRVTFELDLPERLAWHTEVQGYAEDLNELRDGRRIRRWSYGNPVAKKPEGSQVDALFSLPHLMITSFSSWEALAQAYMDRHAPQAEVTSEILRLAQELTEGVSDPREKAKRLYDWVRSNIRYVAIFAGLENWVPHKASDVLANRYGDCKDHAALLDALLHASGIDSVPVLVQADTQNYQLPDVALPTFNHVITYLPELNLYLDSTSVHTEFGRLPEADQGKPVMRVRIVPALDTTPGSNAGDRRVQRTTHIHLNEKGGATRETTLRVARDFREWFESFRQSIGPGKENVWAQNRLDALKVRGNGSLEFLGEENEMVGMKVSQTVENYLSTAESGLIAFSHAENGPASIKVIADLFAPKSRSTPFRCHRVDIEDVIRITVPETLTILRLPKNREVLAEGVAFKASYSQDGREYTMTRHFRWDPGASFRCTKENWQAWVKPMRQVASALNSGALVFER